MIDVDIEFLLKQDDLLIIDTRSPGEYEIDHIKGAISFPLFDNVERSEIGTLYKADKDEAFDLGVEYFSKKMPLLMKKIKSFDAKRVLVYCWRGGTRSKAMAQLFDLLDFEVFRLKGGYKAYRNYVVDYLSKVEKKFIVLWGNTGVGKTKVLLHLDSVLDLEGLAQHRGSLFGGVGLKKQTQKYFETLLFFKLRELSELVFVEAESRKVGDIIIPKNIFEQILSGTNVLVEASVETRVNNIVEEYFKPDLIPEIKEIIPKLKQRLGAETINELLLWLEEGKYSEITEFLLINYYDPLYRHSAEGISYDLVVSTDDIDSAVNKINEVFVKND